MGEKFTRIYFGVFEKDLPSQYLGNSWCGKISGAPPPSWSLQGRRNP
jgi:hypothetical protein